MHHKRGFSKSDRPLTHPPDAAKPSVQRASARSSRHTFALRVSLGTAIVLTAASVTSTVLHLQPFAVPAATSPDRVCRTIATDPNPPLNVRSSPVVATDNVVANLRNGTQLTVIDENEGWLRINHPLEGWVSKRLTVTSCVSAASASAPVDRGLTTLAEATESYHAGDLSAAIAQANAIPTTSAVHPSAQGAIVQWQRDWKTAETEFQTAQKASKTGNWQTVLTIVERFPDNRYWKEKLTPIVAQAIQHQHDRKK